MSQVGPPTPLHVILNEQLAVFGQLGLPGHVCPPGQVIVPALVGPQAGSPGQVSAPTHVGQNAATHVTAPGIVGGMQAGLPAGQVGQPC